MGSKFYSGINDFNGYKTFSSLQILDIPPYHFFLQSEHSPY